MIHILLTLIYIIVTILLRTPQPHVVTFLCISNIKLPFLYPIGMLYHLGLKEKRPNFVFIGVAAVISEAL